MGQTANNEPPSGPVRARVRTPLLHIVLAVARALGILLLFSLALWLAAWLLPGVTMRGVRAPLGVAVATLLAMFVVWPLFMRFFFKLAVWTAGLAVLVVNGLIILVASWINNDLVVKNLGWAVLYSFVATVLFSALLALFSVQDQSLWRRLLSRRQRRLLDPAVVGKPGVIFLEIDGLSHDALRRAMAAGKARTMRRWVESGSHRLVGWECDLSSQTSASQAGILHGNNNGIPAFRWFDKDLGRVVVSSKPGDLGVLEHALSNGDGLLARGGTARASMLSGDADEVMMVASRLQQEKTESYRAFFFAPFNFSRTLGLVLWEVLLETGSKWKQKIIGVQPRIDRRFVYALVRAVMSVALRDFSINTLIGDMYAGVPYSYATLAGYDEVAHHSGLDRHDTLAVLRKLDSRFRLLQDAARSAPRRYQFVVLSDHGQTQGATFLQRYGITLEQLVQAHVSPGTTVGGPSTYAKERAGAGVGQGQSDWEQWPPSMTPCRSRASSAGGSDAPLGNVSGAGDQAPLEILTDVVVLASGNMGLVSFTRRPERTTFEEIERDHPELVQNLADHPGIGFVMLATDGPGPVVVGAEGRRFLADGRVEGVDPLAGYGPNAARHLMRTHEFRTCPDLLVVSFLLARAARGRGL